MPFLPKHCGKGFLTPSTSNRRTKMMISPNEKTIVVVEAVEFKNSLNVSYIIYRLIINKSSEFMKKNQYFFGLSSKKVCFRHIV